MLPEFFLAPFDVVHPNHPCPRADFVGVWKGDEYAVRNCNGILHFRRVSNESESSDESKGKDTVPVFAVVPPLSTELEDAKELWLLLWEEAMQSEQIARFLNFPFRGSFDRDFPFYLGFNGQGWVRESWNRDDCPFEDGFSPTLARFGHDSDLMDSVTAIFHEAVIHCLEELPVPQPLDDAQAEWLCGSLDELTRVTRAICAIEPVFSRKSTRLQISCETPFERAMLWGAAGLFSRPWHDGKYGAPQMLDSQRTLSPRFWVLMELALDFNTPSGLYWEYHDNGRGRTAYSPHSSWLEIEVPVPSTHEQLEAHHFLREWLRGKLPTSEIEVVLTNDRT